MNYTTQSFEAPRRSGRERKQTESVYTEAKMALVAERKKKGARIGNAERGNMKRKQSDEESYDEHFYEDDDFASSNEEHNQSDASSDDEDERGSESRRTDNRVELRANPSYKWRLISRDANHRRSFQSVDGDEIFCVNMWGGVHPVLTRDAAGALGTAQKSLIDKQGKRSITLERIFHRKTRITQVPYHPDMLPFYECFAEGIQSHSSLETFSITNYHLPSSPWIGNIIVPILEKNKKKLTALELSNCSLSADDISILVTFVSKNKHLSTLNISRNNIESADTVKELAKAIKKHPFLCNVNLAYCSLAGGGNYHLVETILTACKTCNSLEIGHEDFDSKSVAVVAKFIGKKNSLKSFSLMGAAVDKNNKKLLSEALVKNKTLEKFCLRSNNLQLPAVIRNTKKINKSLSRLIFLDLSYNSLSIAGVTTMAKFLEERDCKLASLILSNNHLTTKGGTILLPAIKQIKSLKHLDLSNNWLNDSIAPIVVDMLKNNCTLVKFDLTGNKSLKSSKAETTRRSWRQRSSEGGRLAILKGALFDTACFESITNSNHTVELLMSGCNHGDSFESTIRKINGLDASEGKKIRYKIVLALNHVNEDLYDPHKLDNVPLGMIPYLLEMLQQRIGFDGFALDIAPKGMNMKGVPTEWIKKHGAYNPLTRKMEKVSKDVRSLSRIYEVIMSSQSLPLLFVRGPGELMSTKIKVVKEMKTKKKSDSKPRKRRKFGDDGDDEDEPWIPKGARMTGTWR